MTRSVLVSLCVLVFPASALVQASDREITVDTRDKLIAALRGAKPGDSILLSPGTYDGGIYLEGLQGTAEKPIVVAARDPENPPVIEGGGNGIHLIDAAHVELRRLVLSGATGNGLSIDDGGSFDTPAKSIVLRNVTIRDVGPQGNRDGLKLSGVDGFVIENCRISKWGASGSAIDMVGCHNGRIARCSFENARGAEANGVQAKGGSTKVTVSGCRFENAGGRAVNIGGSTGKDYFRPLRREQQAQGYEAKEIIVEDCLFIGSMAPAAFVGVDGAEFRYNTIYRPTRWVLRILQENQDQSLVPCRNGRFENNLIVFNGAEVSTAVNVGPKTAPETFLFENNAWHCLDRPEDTARFVQLPVKEKGGEYGKAPQFRDTDAGDFRLAEDSPLSEVGARGEVGAAAD